MADMGGAMSAIGAKRDPPSVSYQTQSSRWPPPEFLYKRTARKQVAKFMKRGVEEMMGNYNIWYGKYESIQGRQEGRGKGAVAETRCVTASDIGRSRGSDNPAACICYLFAQGRCHNVRPRVSLQGPECSFLHKLPDEEFDARADTAKDCFGRERHTTDSENMGGVGNMMRDSKTLYVGRLVVRSTETGDQLEERVRTHFGEFGELDSCKVFPKRCIAFLQFRFRSGAELAKIAMADQDLGAGDVINVRWASDDPNPKHIELTRRKTQEQVKDALEKNGYGTTTEEFDYPINYQVPVKRAKLDDEDGVAAAAAKDGKVAYPDTDAQFESAAQPEETVEDLFTKLKDEAEVEAGNNNWLRDTAWAAVRQAESAAETAAATAAPAAAAGGHTAEQMQQWRTYYASVGYTAEQLQQWERSLQT